MYAVRTHVHVGLNPSLQMREEGNYVGDDLPGALALALADLDRRVLEAVRASPLLLDQISIGFTFTPCVPREPLGQSWAKAAAFLGEIVNIFPEPTESRPGPGRGR